MFEVTVAGFFEETIAGFFKATGVGFFQVTGVGFFQVAGKIWSPGSNGSSGSSLLYLEGLSGRVLPAG